jgi:hypothetical protein
MPEAQTCLYLGQMVPLLRLAAFEASTPAKIRLALAAAAAARRPARGIARSVGRVA